MRSLVNGVRGKMEGKPGSPENLTVVDDLVSIAR